MVKNVALLLQGQGDWIFMGVPVQTTERSVNLALSSSARKGGRTFRDRRPAQQTSVRGTFRDCGLGESRFNRETKSSLA